MNNRECIACKDTYHEGYITDIECRAGNIPVCGDCMDGKCGPNLSSAIFSALDGEDKHEMSLYTMIHTRSGW